MSGGMPVKVLHERPADDLGGFDVFSCCPIIEPRLDVDGQPNGSSRGVPARKLPAGRPATIENDLGAGSGNRLTDGQPGTSLDVGLQFSVFRIGTATSTHDVSPLYLRWVLYCGYQ